MDNLLTLLTVVSSTTLGVSEAVECVRKYVGSTEKVFDCVTCCGEPYTRYCCEANVKKAEAEEPFDYVTAVLVVGCLLALIAIVVGILLAVFYFKCGHTNKQQQPPPPGPPTILLHQPSVDNQGSSIYSNDIAILNETSESLDSQEFTNIM